MNVTRLAGEHDELMITQNSAAAWVQSRPPANPECFPASPAPPHPASTLPEVLGFAVPQFVSGKAHRALQRVAANRPMAHQLRLREAHLLQVGRCWVAMVFRGPVGRTKVAAGIGGGAVRGHMLLCDHCTSTFLSPSPP